MNDEIQSRITPPTLERLISTLRYNKKRRAKLSEQLTKLDSEITENKKQIAIAMKEELA